MSTQHKAIAVNLVKNIVGKFFSTSFNSVIIESNVLLMDEAMFYPENSYYFIVATSGSVGMMSAHDVLITGLVKEVLSAVVRDAHGYHVYAVKHVQPEDQLCFDAWLNTTAGDEAYTKISDQLEGEALQEALYNIFDGETSASAVPDLIRNEVKHLLSTLTESDLINIHTFGLTTLGAKCLAKSKFMGEWMGFTTHQFNYLGKTYQLRANDRFGWYFSEVSSNSATLGTKVGDLSDTSGVFPVISETSSQSMSDLSRNNPITRVDPELGWPIDDLDECDRSVSYVVEDQGVNTTTLTGVFDIPRKPASYVDIAFSAEDTNWDTTSTPSGIELSIAQSIIEDMFSVVVAGIEYEDGSKRKFNYRLFGYSQWLFIDLGQALSDSVYVAQKKSDVEDFMMDSPVNSKVAHDIELTALDHDSDVKDANYNIPFVFFIGVTFEAFSSSVVYWTLSTVIAYCLNR